ncbi:MAG: hypothetical protein AB7T31_15025 [Gemmatimonadales bacterium]
MHNALPPKPGLQEREQLAGIVPGAAPRLICGALHPRGDLAPCDLEPGHVGYCSSAFRVGGRGRVCWAPNVTPAPATDLRLEARPPWEPHRFPERKRDGTPRYLSREVKRARALYTCESIDLAPGHRAKIQPGEPYVRVRIAPQGRGGLARWRHVRLCAWCALAYELVYVIDAGSQPPGGA